ncbi:MAG: type IV pilus assembly protein PilM [Planctomycetes bacterium]|nr:type IV pilus assembly protein PilM [Planctomycetota bacterium]
MEAKHAWGIEVGEFALKAVRLQLVGEQVSVVAFEVIPHTKVLSDPSVSDRAGMVQITLGAFVQRHEQELSTEPIVMSLPSSMAFARFAAIPAVDAKSLRSMVEYEAKQQIPFPIDEVEWDSHVLPPDDAGQCAIGIFAVTKDRLQELLGLLAENGLEPDVLTLSSVAVYNALQYDLQLDEGSPSVACLDIGTNTSDLIVMSGPKMWIRTFALGGSQFTQAIADAFASQNIDYSRAEAVKVQRNPNEKTQRGRTMAMRNVTAQLVEEVGRSREFFLSANDGAALDHIIGVGSTLKISGLRTKIAGDLQLKVERLERFKRIEVNGPDPVKFEEGSINLLTAVGLGLQGLGLAKVPLNLAPIARVRKKVWQAKTPWFVAAAALLVLASISMFARVMLDRIALSNIEPVVERASSTAQRGKAQLGELQRAQEVAGVGASDSNALDLLAGREVWPWIVHDTFAALQASAPASVETGMDPQAIRAIDLARRRLVRLEDLSGEYTVDPSTQARVITVSARIRLSGKNADKDLDPTQFLNNEQTGVLAWLRANKDRAEVPYVIETDALDVPKWVEVKGGKLSEELPPSGDTGSEGGFGSAASGSAGIAAGGAGAGQSGGGALKKRNTGPIEDKPTGFRGSIGSGDDAPSGAESDEAEGPSGSGAVSRRRAKTQVSSAEGLPEVDMDKEAPLPQAPRLVGVNDKEFEGVLKFRLKLRASGAPGSSPEGAAQ